MKQIMLFFCTALLLSNCKPKDAKTTETHTTTTTESTQPATSGLVQDSTTAADGSKLYMTYDTAKSTVSVNFNGTKIDMQQQPSGSGIRYAGNGYEYEEWQQEIRLFKDGKIVFENELSSKNKTNAKPEIAEEPDMPEAFIGPKGERLNVGYDTKGEKPVAHIAYFDDPIETLTQTEAWAKGAIYKNDNMTWEVSGLKGTLTVDGKKIVMKKVN